CFARPAPGRARRWKPGHAARSFPPNEIQTEDSMSTLTMEPEHKSSSTESGAFKPGLWSREINVRNFMLLNYEPYYGDGSFLAGPTSRTTAIWDKLSALFVKEREKGVLDVSQIPSSITAHDAGYIDRDNEVIV